MSVALRMLPSPASPAGDSASGVRSCKCRKVMAAAHGARSASSGRQRLSNVPGPPHSAASDRTAGISLYIIARAVPKRSVSVRHRHALPTGIVVFHVKQKAHSDLRC